MVSTEIADQKIGKRFGVLRRAGIQGQIALKNAGGVQS